MGKNKFSLRCNKTLLNKQGFTLVEMSVTLAIVALLGALSLASFIGAKRQVYIAHLANRLTSDVRRTFIQAISTEQVNNSSDTVCNGRNPKILAMRIVLSGTAGFTGQNGEYQLIPYCVDSTGNFSMGRARNIDPGESLNYSQDVSSYITQYQNNDSSQAQAGIGRVYQGALFLVFTSPYGRFYSYYDSSGTPDDGSFIQNGTCGTWQENASNGRAYEPTGVSNILNCAGSSLSRLDNGGLIGANPTSVFLTFDTSRSASSGIYEINQDVRISANGSADLSGGK